MQPSSWGASLWRSIFPSSCLVCDRLTQPGERLCPDCSRSIGNDVHFTCPRCTSSVAPFMDLESGCPRCRDQRLDFDEAVRLGLYEGCLRDAILRLKSVTGEGLGWTLGQAMARWRGERINAWNGDLLVPVPLHWLRRWQRGYNQSEAIAQGMSSVLGLPVSSQLLRRTRRTVKQFNLTGAMRESNVRGAFGPGSALGLQGKKVILVDDVLTTGFTLSECARVLKKMGVAWIGVAVLAHR